MSSDTTPVFHITFVRHGESTGNAENRLQGLADFPLSDVGREQVQALAERWKAEGVGFDTVITSPLSRAAETARIIAAVLKIPELEFDPLWLERDMGQRSGMTMDEIQAQFTDPDFVNPFTPLDESGESDWALYLRAGGALHKILLRPPARYLVVTHGAILNMALYAILGIAPQPHFQGPRFGLENTAFAAFRYFPESHRWRVDVIGDRTHWPVRKGEEDGISESNIWHPVEIGAMERAGSAIPPTKAGMGLMPLNAEFYAQDSLKVARGLLGARLVRVLDGVRLAGLITETEAYIGEADKACHARAGRTPRTQIMYGPPGRAYVYFTYGMHWMLNAVTEPEGSPAAVLIRAVRLESGLEVVESRRQKVKREAWTDGPAKLTRAFGIDGLQNGLDLTGSASELWIEAGVVISDANVTIGPRVGLYSVPEPWKSMPWRFRVTE